MRRAGFTLIELILVLAILAVMVAIVAPALARSSRGHQLDQEVMRFVALTECARDEAISQGVAMTVYVETQTQRYGMEPASGTSGVDSRKDYTLQDDLHFEEIKTLGKKEGRVITYTAEGVPDVYSVDTITISNSQGDTKSIVRQTDGYAYEVAQEVIK